MLFLLTFFWDSLTRLLVFNENECNLQIKKGESGWLPCQHQSVNNDILKGRLAKQRRREHQQGVEPTVRNKHKVRVTIKL